MALEQTDLHRALRKIPTEGVGSIVSHRCTANYQSNKMIRGRRKKEPTTTTYDEEETHPLFFDLQEDN